MSNTINAHAKNLPFPRNYAEELLIIERGEGVHLYDAKGKKYLDFGSGIAVNALGHGRKDLAEIASDQMKKLIHVSNLYTTKAALELGERLLGTGEFEAVHLGNSGAEANETALKYARLYAKRTRGEGNHRILSFEGGFHGRTLGALAVTPSPKYQEPFTPLMAGCIALPYNDVVALEETLNDGFAAVIVEPIQGEGGMESITRNFADALNRICTEKDIILIADEVQTGLGRTGKFYGSVAPGLRPDIITLAKPLGGGLPLSATLIPGKINRLLGKGEHGTTFGGGPVTSAVANYMMDIILNADFLQGVEKRGLTLASQLASLATRFSCLGVVKGRGLIQGIEVLAPEGREEELTGKIIARAQEEGLLLLRSGRAVLRILPPLTIKDAQIVEGVKILERTLIKMGLGPDETL